MGGGVKKGLWERWSDSGGRGNKQFGKGECNRRKKRVEEDGGRRNEKWMRERIKLREKGKEGERNKRREDLKEVGR